MIIIIVVIAGFNNTVNLTNAYGCVRRICLKSYAHQYIHFQLRRCHCDADHDLSRRCTVQVRQRLACAPWPGLLLDVWVLRWYVTYMACADPSLTYYAGLFWGAALKKVPQGAWVPLMIGIIM